MYFLFKILIRAATVLIPKKLTRKRVRSALLLAVQKKEIQKKLRAVRRWQKKIKDSCKRKISSGGRLKVAFLVCDASTFSAEPVFNKMLKDPLYECFIAVVPRLTRGDNFKNETLEKTYSELSQKYGNAVSLFYDAKNDKATSLLGKADIVFTSIIYEDQTCDDFTVETMSEYSLVALISYGYSGLFKANAEKTIFLPNIIYSWKFFISNPQIRNLWISRNALLSENAIVSGYAKMDRLHEFKISKSENDRKKIILSPHHTLTKETDGLILSNFLRFADFFLSLPERYPQIDFVFRPHPLLFPRLANDTWWGTEKTAQYKKKIESYPNVEFQQGGDYLETFAKSSAIIHDCGSFLAEYFYTGMPQCYLMNEKTENQFLPFGKKLLNYVYKAETEMQILNFIDRIVLGDDDQMQAERTRFALESICINYPNATDKIVETISKALS